MIVMMIDNEVDKAVNGTTSPQNKENYDEDNLSIEYKELEKDEPLLSAETNRWVCICVRDEVVIMLR